MKDPQPEEDQQPASPGDEHALLARIVAGEPDALATLMARYWRPLMAYLVRTFGWGRDEAEDVVQEVFIRVWQLAAWDSAAGTVKAFLFRVARNLALARTRHYTVRTRAGTALLEEASVALPTPLDELQGRELGDALREALALLPERRREALILVRYQGLSLDEAAALMDLKRKTVANHVTMALEDLRRLLASRLD